jgi:imidazolonepropionase-like amidohydrolase
MAPQRAISAATRINARILGKANDLGTIEPGKLADIIVVKGDPVFDIQALAHVEVVMKGGVIYKGATPAAARRPTAPQRSQEPLR